MRVGGANDAVSKCKSTLDFCGALNPLPSNSSVMGGKVVVNCSSEMHHNLYPNPIFWPVAASTPKNNV